MKGLGLMLKHSGFHPPFHTIIVICHIEKKKRHEMKTGITHDMFTTWTGYWSIIMVMLRAAYNCVINIVQLLLSGRTFTMCMCMYI